MQKSAGKVLASIFWDQDGILLIDYFPNGQTANVEYYSSLLVLAIEGHYEAKTPMPQEGHQGGLVLARKYPSSPATCNPEETGLPGLPVSWSPTLFSGSVPVGLPPFSLYWKNNWNVAIFLPAWRSLLPRRPGWTDSFLIFYLSGLQKVEQWTKKSTEFRGECVEQIPSLVAAACFLPVRAKYLSASHPIWTLLILLKLNHEQQNLIL